MSKRIEQPVTVADPTYKGNERTKTTHPAYGQIRAARVTGGTHLYGSDFKHHDYITIEISHSELCRDLSQDWHFPRKQIIGVNLSEAQWATFISALNSGGVPCTLDHIQGESLPALPAQEKRHDQFAREMQRTLKETVDRLDELRKAIQATSLSQKQKDRLLLDLDVAGYGVGSSIDYVTKQFGEHMETVTEHAKSEIEAYINGRIQRAGIAALQGPKPIELTDETKVDHD